MNDTIFLKSVENTLIPLKETLYESEDFLQELIEKNPSILAGEQITPDNPRKWILIDREMGIPCTQDGSAFWFLDHLFIVQDGIPTFVEVKRSTDSRIRREVVGQMLDYAANATKYWRVSEIQQLYQGDLKEVFAFDDLQCEAFWENVDNNLHLGKIRLLFAADTIPESLLRIIEFLNNQMQNAEVLGLEVKQFSSDDGRQIFVPRILGRTTQSIEVKKKDSREWDYDSFSEQILAIGGQEICTLSQQIIKDFSDLNCQIWYGKGATHSSMMVICHANNKKKMQLFSIYPWIKGIYFEICFMYYKFPYDSKESRIQLKEQFESALSVSIPENKWNGRPNLPLNILLNHNKYNQFLKIMQEMIHTFFQNNQ